MSDLRFARLIETNEHEAATWNFWLQVNGNEDGLDRLADFLETDDDEPHYVLTQDELTEPEVDLLVRFADENYMMTHNKVVGVLVLPDGLADEEPDHWFYKGQIEKLFVAPTEEGADV